VKTWSERPREEAHLINPAFCCAILTSSVAGYSSLEAKGMPFPIAFIVLPTVLHKLTREAFPRNARTSLAAWLEEHGEVKVQFHERLVSLMPFVREALLFGMLHKWLVLTNAGRVQIVKAESDVQRFIRRSEGEAKECISRALFVGKWFAASGSVETVMALWGVRP
jgi:hypothetical protein